MLILYDIYHFPQPIFRHNLSIYIFKVVGCKRMYLKCTNDLSFKIYAAHNNVLEDYLQMDSKYISTPRPSKGTTIVHEVVCQPVII